MAAQRQIAERIDSGRYREIILALGRRSGKNFLGAILALHDAAFRDLGRYLRRRERRYVVFVAANREQAGLTLQFVRELIEGAPCCGRRSRPNRGGDPDPAAAHRPARRRQDDALPGAAFVPDQAALAIVGRDRGDQNRLRLVLVRSWRPEGGELGFTGLLDEVAQLCRQHRVSRVAVDQYCSVPVRSTSAAPASRRTR